MLPRGAEFVISCVRPRPAAAVLACAIAFAGGCKSVGGGGGGPKDATPVSRNTDPLLGGGRIPPQNLPIPGRDSYGARDRRDPLLGAPAGGKSREPVEAADRSDGTPGEKAARGPARTSRPAGNSGELAVDPYRPGKTTTNAALAGRISSDDSSLSIGDRRPAVSPTGSGPVPLQSRDEPASTGGWTFDQIETELKRYGATVGSPVREPEGGYVVRADLALGDPGRVRRYEGVGDTPAAAAKQILDQVRGDAGR